MELKNHLIVYFISIDASSLCDSNLIATIEHYYTTERQCVQVLLEFYVEKNR
jgi:hypothetical protein